VWTAWPACVSAVLSKTFAVVNLSSCAAAAITMTRRSHWTFLSFRRYNSFPHHILDSFFLPRTVKIQAVYLHIYIGLWRLSSTHRTSLVLLGKSRFLTGFSGSPPQLKPPSVKTRTSLKISLIVHVFGKTRYSSTDCTVTITEVLLAVLGLLFFLHSIYSVKDVSLTASTFLSLGAGPSLSADSSLSIFCI